MSETTSACRWVSTTEPRVVPSRHVYGCEEETCRGCQPCTEAHCRVDGRTHVNTAGAACPECVAEARGDLREIGRLCNALPEEVEHRGVEGEAMMLLGPSTDPEAWGHREASARAGRIPADYLDEARDELHPLFVLGGWDMVYRDAFEHSEAEAMTLAVVVDYLDRNLTYAATWPHVPFEDMARDLRRCVSHLERVLHDENQGDRANVGCFECGGDLERKLTKTGFDDFWTCGRCRRRYTPAEYNFALRAAIETETERSA
jgi:hypothetical protein